MIITLTTKEILIQNKCQMKCLEKLVMNQNFDHKLMMNLANCSMLESPYTYDLDDVENDVSKSTVLELTINS